MKDLKIAIVGAGITGLAAAAFLQRDGHQVTLFEKYNEPRASGAGLVLQLTGLSVLAELGLDEQAIEYGSKIGHFFGRNSSDKIVFNLFHRQLSPAYFSLGIHRHALFNLLYEHVLGLGVQIVGAFEGDAAVFSAGPSTLISKDGREFSGYDLIVDASGTHSVLRDKYAAVASNLPFKYGTLWGVCKNTGAHPQNMLRQRFHQAQTGLGLIPIGRKPGAGSDQHIALLWNMNPAQHQKWKANPLSQWQDEVARFCPEAADLVSQFESHDDLFMASYREIILKQFHYKNMVFVGDAGHSLSPRLGQGANLGLMDAYILSRVLRTSLHVETALADYSAVRRNHIGYYHWISRWMTTLFQSDNVAASFLRDLVFGHLCAFPVTRRQMLLTMSGLKDGIFTSLDANVLHPRYRLN